MCGWWVQGINNFYPFVCVDGEEGINHFDPFVWVVGINNFDSGWCGGY